ncbi:MAG: MerR family transcriptional regulator [Myxococcales bacterium]|nr:MerR family transcriptional regulator [Myxococcales bacterium]MCB9547646.1 MerR family transcriptional regulator [Myxococcales bacterium]
MKPVAHAANAQYRIQTVARLTGVPSPTLRAWERRYGIPSPQRTESSYRLYTDADVELIRRLKELCDQGMAPSQAADVVRRMAENEPPAVDELPTDAWQVAAERIIDAVKRFDPSALEMAVQRSMLLGSARTIFDRVFAPALRRIGDEWHAGQLSIAQEHLASEYLGNATRELLRLVQPTAPLRTVVLACIAGEYHVMALYGTALHFVQWGYRVVILGVDTPPEALADSVASLHPHAVGLSATQVHPREQFAQILTRYADAIGPTPWVIGGHAANQHGPLIDRLGGILARQGQDPEAVRDALEVRLRERRVEAAGA